MKRQTRHVRIQLDFVIQLQHSVDTLPGLSADDLVVGAAEAAYDSLPEELKLQGKSCLLAGANVRQRLDFRKHE